MSDDTQRLDLSEAVSVLQSMVATQNRSQVLPLRSALGRVCATDLAAPIALPPFPSSAMDGYAFASDRLPTPAVLRQIGVSAAGHPFHGSLSAGECVRILTGAVVPAGADTVVIQEDVQLGDTEDKHPKITLVETPSAGSNVRQIGNDVQQGAPLVQTGQQLNAFSLGWLAACGIENIAVFERPVVGLLSTGDELRPAGSSLGAGEIFDSNRLLLTQLLEPLPVELVDLGTAPDDHREIRNRIQRAASTCDAILSTGGVSVGDADHVTNVLRELGQITFWRLNLKPGKPMAVGQIDDCWFFGLPGNPVSCAVTALLVARPALLQLSGAQPETKLPLLAKLSQRVNHRPGREEYLRGSLISQQNEQWVTPNPDQGSNRLGSFVSANCLIRIPKTAEQLDQGTLVDVIALKDFN